MINANGDLLRVQPTPGSIVEVVGTADPHALQPGQVVRSRGLFESLGNNKLQAAGPLTDVEIITPCAGEAPGTFTLLPADAAQINVPNQVAREQTLFARWLLSVGFRSMRMEN